MIASSGQPSRQSHGIFRFTEARNDHHHARDEAAEELALAYMGARAWVFIDRFDRFDHVGRDELD
jgi:hypothetical protein